MDFKTLISSDPDAFMQGVLAAETQGLSFEFAAYLDAQDPLPLRALFDIQDIHPFAGHSLGPSFKPALEEINQILQLQASHLHAGHFSATQDLGGNWFDCDIEAEAIDAMQAMLGFKSREEFVFAQSGLSQNLANLLSTFYLPSATDWAKGRTKIAYLSGEFFSDQAVIHTIIEREKQRAKAFDVDCYLPLEADEQGLYCADKIIATVQKEAQQLQVLHLSDIVFNTGQRLNLPYILKALKSSIIENNICVGLDLAHTVGNRTINLAELEVVTYAVGCAYKHCSGSSGSPFGFYVNQDADLQAFPPIQGWKAADSEQVFAKINAFDENILFKSGAWAFRASNTSPVALAAIKTYIKHMSALGWDQLMAKSECLTRYLLHALKKALGERLQLITPEAPKARGATLVFRIKGLEDSAALEAALLKKSAWGQFEVDTRPPNNVRVTAHYGYTRFIDIYAFVQALKEVIET